MEAQALSGFYGPANLWAKEPPVGRVRDPFGNIWWLQSHATNVSPDRMQTWMEDPAMVEAMRYVQETLADALRKRPRHH